REKAPGMDHDHYDDSYIRGILNTVKTIAMVGVSANTSRPSYFAFKYLLEQGYRMIPVNPGLAGQELLWRRAYAKLADVSERIHDEGGRRRVHRDVGHVACVVLRGRIHGGGAGAPATLASELDAARHPQR